MRNDRCSITQLDEFLHELKLVGDNMLFGMYMELSLSIFNKAPQRFYLAKEQTNNFLRRKLYELDRVWEVDYLTSHPE